MLSAIILQRSFEAARGNSRFLALLPEVLNRWIRFGHFQLISVSVLVWWYLNVRVSEKLAIFKR